MGVRARWMKLGRWVAPHGMRTLENVGVVAMYLVMMGLLLIVPAILFLAITRHAGANVDGALKLTPTGYVLLDLVLALTFVWSFVTGGLARAFLRPEHLDWPWLVVLGIALLVGLTRTGSEMHEAIGPLHPAPGNDNVQAITFFAFWLLMIGYASKAVWDEARDQIATLVEREIAKNARKVRERDSEGASDE